MSNQESDFELVLADRRRVAIARNLKKVVETKVISATSIRVDLTYLLWLKESREKAFEIDVGAPLRIEIWILKSMAEALKIYPQLNADFVDGEAPQIKFYKRINIGVAFAESKGLLVPVAKDVDKKNFKELARELKRLYQGAVSGKLVPRDYKEGTVTFNNPGVMGGVSGFSIMSPGETAIVSLQAIEENFRATLGFRKEALLNLNFDHQVADAREALGFLMSVRKFLENERKLIALIQ